MIWRGKEQINTRTHCANRMRKIKVQCTEASATSTWSWYNTDLLSDVSFKLVLCFYLQRFPLFVGKCDLVKDGIYCITET